MSIETKHKEQIIMKENKSFKDGIILSIISVSLIVIIICFITEVTRDMYDIDNREMFKDIIMSLSVISIPTCTIYTLLSRNK